MSQDSKTLSQKEKEKKTNGRKELELLSKAGCASFVLGKSGSLKCPRGCLRGDFCVGEGGASSSQPLVTVSLLNPVLSG